MCDRYAKQLELARGLVEAFDAHRALHERVKIGEPEEVASFDRLREARHALFDFHREACNGL